MSRNEHDLQSNRASDLNISHPCHKVSESIKLESKSIQEQDLGSYNSNVEVIAHDDSQSESMSTKSVEEQIISDDETESVYAEINDQYSDDSFPPKNTKRMKKDNRF